MKTGIHAEHWVDAEGHPAGGCSYGAGFAISWQNGPLGRGDLRHEPNGAFVEDLIAVVIDRLLFYQTSEFAFEANEQAITALRSAAHVLDERTAERERR